MQWKCGIDCNVSVDNTSGVFDLAATTILLGPQRSGRALKLTPGVSSGEALHARTALEERLPPTKKSLEHDGWNKLTSGTHAQAHTTRL